MALFPYPRLVADVGGTNARFAMVAGEGAMLSDMVRLPTGGDADFAETVQKAIQQAGFPKPKSFLLAVAGPVADRRAILTNAETATGSLMIDGADLAERLKLEQGMLFNDFEALCLALPGLAANSLFSISDGVAVADEPMVVVGPGTGLGVGALLKRDGLWIPVPSEGGHVDLGPTSPEEFALWSWLGEGRISAEDLLSGRGLLRLYKGVCVQSGQEPRCSDAAEVTHMALSGEPMAQRAVQHFLTLLARMSGNMALTFGARGGVFIGGGIAPRFSDSFDRAGFVRSFEDKGVASGYLKGIPIQLITAPDAALQGLAAVAREPERYGLSFAERCWR